MNICKIRYIPGTLLLSLVLLLCSCAANPPVPPQLINAPAPAENNPVTGPGMQDTPIPAEPSRPVTVSATSSDNLSNYYGKAVIVEGTVVELGMINDPGLGKALVLYFNNPNQHVTVYEAWSKGMTGTDFRVIIRESDMPRFCYQSMFVGCSLAIEGELDTYHDAPVIFVSDPSQLTFAGATPVTEPALSIVITRTTEIADNITCYRYQGTITNNNTEWAVHDLYLGDNKLADCIPPKGCPNIAPMYIGKQTLTKPAQCLNYIKFDVRYCGDVAAGAGADPLTRQISIPALQYKWKSVPKQ